MSGVRTTRRGFLATAGMTAAGALLLDPDQARADSGDAGGHTMIYRPASVAAMDNQTFVTGGDRKAVFHWDISQAKHWKGTYKTDSAAWARSRKVSFVAVDQSKKFVFQASHDGDIAVSKVGDFLNPPVTRFTEHYLPNTLPRFKPQVWVVVPNSDGSKALSATNSGEIRLWDTSSGKTLAGVPQTNDPIGGLSFVGDNAFLVGQGDGNMILYAIVQVGATYKIVQTNKFSHGNLHPVNTVAATSDGQTAVSAGFDMTVRIWDVASATPTPLSPIRDNIDIVWRVAISPNKPYKIATASEDGTVRLYDITGKPYKNGAANAFKKETVGVMGVAFLTDTQIVYTYVDPAKSNVDPAPPTDNGDPHIDDEYQLWDITGLTA